MPPLDKAHQLERRARTIVESLQGYMESGQRHVLLPGA
jgi:putative DNA primase/helicase